MSADQRLDRLYPMLTAQERGLLVLQAYKAGEQPDRQIYRTTPPEQARDFNHYIRLMNACNVELATLLIILREQVKQTELKHTWFNTLLIWGLETLMLGEAVLAATNDRKLRKDVRRMMARAPSDLQVPVDLTPPLDEPTTFEKGYGDELMRAVLFGIKRDVQQHWIELRSIELGVAKVAEEFGGEDPLKPDMREMLDDGLLSCTSVRDSVTPYVEFDLPEPSDEDVAEVPLLIEKVVEG